MFSPISTSYTPTIFSELLILVFVMEHIDSCLVLRKGSNNEHVNLRWFFPLRGGGLEFHRPILQNEISKNHVESFPDCEKVFCT